LCRRRINTFLNGEKRLSQIDTVTQVLTKISAFSFRTGRDILPRVMAASVH
jgi:hypothetical protein